MNGFLRQSTASQVRTIGPFVDDTDFKTLKDALTIANTDIKIKKNGAASASKNSGGATADGAGGLYAVTWDATDTATVGELSVSVKVAGSLVYFCTYTVLSAAAYDATFASAATGYVTDQPVNVTKWAGNTTTTGDIAIKTTLAKTTHITGFNDISTANVQTELVTYGALKPTVAARTLDVTATGEAGVDWANIGGPTTTVALTGTTIGTVTNLTNDPPGVTTLLSRVTSTIFTGITSLKEWLGMLAGKQTGNATARTELRSSGAGSGTFDETTDSQEALRDRGDAAWITGAGGDPWATALPGAYGAGTAGNIIGNRLDAAVTTRLAPTTAGRTLDVTTTGEAGIDWANIGAPTTTVALTNTTVGLTAAYDSAKTAAQPGSAMTLTAAYDSAKTASTQASVNTLATYVDTEVAAIKVVTDKLDTALELDGAVYRYTVNSLENAPTGGSTPAQIADAVWDELASDHVAAGSMGQKMNAAGGAADPWSTALPGSYAGGTAGKIIGDNLNATVASRATQASVDTIGTNVVAIKGKTDQLSFSGVYVKATLDGALVTLTPTANNDIADAVLKRDWMLMSGEAYYSLLNAARLLRNAWNTTEVANNLVVKKEDGTTTAWTRPVATNAAADPIVGVAT